MTIANGYCQLAQAEYVRGNYLGAYYMARTAMEVASITPEQFTAWINPLPAISYNNRGDWTMGWNAALAAIYPSVTHSMTIFIKSCQIHLEASSKLGVPQNAIEFSNEFLSSFIEHSIRQRVERVFTQLIWARQNISFTDPVALEQMNHFDIEQQRRDVEKALEALLELAHAVQAATISV